MINSDYSYRVKELSILDRIKRGIVRRNFVKEISRYAAYLPPHTGNVQELTSQQARDNFSFFNEQKSARLKIIQPFLANYDLHIDHQKPDRNEMLRLDGWAYQFWPGIFKEHLWKKNVYSFDFKGVELNIRAFLFDVSVLLGECFINATKSSRWVIDCSDESRNDDAVSFNRIVILETLPDEYAGKRDPVYDVESHVFYHYGAQKHSDLSKNTDKKMGEILGFPRFRDFEYSCSGTEKNALKYRIYCEDIHVGYVLEIKTDMYRESGKFEFNDKLESQGLVGEQIRKWILDSSLLNEIEDSSVDGDIEDEKRFDEVNDRLELLPKFDAMNWTLVEEKSQKTDKIGHVHFSYGYVGYYLVP